MFTKILMVLASVGSLLVQGPESAGFKGKPDHPLRDAIRQLELGRPLSCGGLTVIPVFRASPGKAEDFVTLEEGLAENWIVISEVEGGRVPQVRISNRSGHMIFLMGGEILTGCRQDRMLASDLLLAPWTKDLIVPVYCVEHGRWRPTSDRFFSKQILGTPALRAKALEKSEDAQAEIWARIEQQNRDLAVPAPTAAFQDAYETESSQARIRKAEQAMKDIPRLHRDTVGVVIGVGSDLVGADIFSSPRLFAAQWPKILRASALSAVVPPGGADLDRDRAAGFLKSLLVAEWRSRPGLDLGIEYISLDSDVSFQALLFHGGLVHVSAFPQEKDRIKVLNGDGVIRRSADQGDPAE